MESAFEEMKRYVRFGEEDERLLRRFHPLAAPHFHRIAEEFYDRTREHHDAAQARRDSEHDADEAAERRARGGWHSGEAQRYTRANHHGAQAH